MSTTAPPREVPIWNIANQLTVARLVLSIVVFVLLSIGWHFVSLWLFLIAVSTDWLDGYFARKYGLVTPLGRILDPFVDKIIICGAFVFLAAVDGSRIVPWMAVVVMGRELLVTAIRSFLEQQGKDFSANLLGKLKMVLQCAAVAFSLYCVSLETQPARWLIVLLDLLVWASIVITLWSGLVYIRRAASLARA